MHVIRDMPEFEVLFARVGRVVNTGTTVPDRVFVDPAWRCRLCSFDLCFSPDLLRSCSGVCRAAGDDEFWFVTVDPDPVAYYFKEFKRFGTIVIQPGEDAESAWSVFEEDPGSSPADALMYATRKFVVTSPGARWAVWGSRDDDVIICGAENTEMLLQFSKGRCRTYDVNTALRGILARDGAFTEQIRANYPER